MIMKIKIKKSLLAAPKVGLVVATTALFAATVQAKVSPEEAAKLGKELTPVGAERAGNAEGTIPAWNPDFKTPAGYKGSGTPYVDPYAAEKPLFTITAKNLAEHKDKLSAGTQKMFETYPDTFKMHIYPSHRDGKYSDFIEKNTILNATRATLADGGNGVRNSFGGAPFPIPQNGEQIIWNANQAGTPYFYSETGSNVVVYRDGNQLVGSKTTTRLAPYFDPNSSLAEFQAKNYPKLFQLVQRHSPTRDKGKSIVVHEPLDQSAMARAAWSYTPGVRRVRRAPTVNYDSPQGLGNFLPVDSSFGFNGATDKYDWKLLGKKELYIPYNSFKFEDPSLSFKEMFPAGHPNPEHMRYELHRVWVVEANLKEGERNVFKKRVLHVEEDGWIPAVVDMYDGRDNLWRVTFVNSINRYDMPGIARRSSIYQDLISREYMAGEVYNKHENKPMNTDIKDVAYFTPSTLRKLGIR